VTFGSNAINPIPTNGFTLASMRHSMLFGFVAFPEKASRVLARATEILAQQGEELAFLQPGSLANGDHSP